MVCPQISLAFDDGPVIIFCHGISIIMFFHTFVFICLDFVREILFVNENGLCWHHDIVVSITVNIWFLHWGDLVISDQWKLCINNIVFVKVLYHQYFYMVNVSWPLLMCTACLCTTKSWLLEFMKLTYTITNQMLDTYHSNYKQGKY